jgi:aspartate kinase
MQEMAESGAKVLNARAVAWAKKHRVEIRARRTADFAPGSAGGRETRVLAELESAARTRAVVGDRRLVRLRTSARAARALLAAAAAAELTLRELTFEAGRSTAFVSLLICPDFERARESLAAALPDPLELVESLAQVSAFGVGLGSDPSLVAEALASLPEPPLVFASRPLCISAVLPESSLLAAERAWHAAFVAEARHGAAA